MWPSSTSSATQGSLNEQHARIQELNEVVRESEQFRKAEAASRILKIPTGDGMALVFYKSPEEPAQCASEISRRAKKQPAPANTQGHPQRTEGARALAFFDWKADTKPLHQTIDEIRTKNPEALKSVADVWFICALAERDVPAAEAALAALGDVRLFAVNATFFTADFGRGLLARMLKDENKARSAFNAARADQEKLVQTQADYGPPVCALAVINSGLGRKEEALRQIQRAVELVPIEKDFLNGGDMIEYSAVVAAWVGDKDLALQDLAKATQLPSFGVTYGRLKLLPWWDPLRGDPRFEKIVASLAPKE